jgi:transcriptional regulator GlxA family with amidase domain
MARDGSGTRSRTRVLLTVLLFALVALGTPLLAGAASLNVKFRPSPMPAFEGQYPVEFPAWEPAKLTAVVVAGVEGSESSDLLAPYQILAETGAFNVYTVAPERKLAPLFPGSPHLAGVDMIPHFSFAEYEQQVGVTPDLIVVPFIPSTDGPVDAPILGWLRENVGESTVILSICGGAKMVADAGLLDRLSATTHHNIFQLVEPDHPNTEWLRGYRWVEDGNVISSAGITSGIDATLRAVERLVDRETAERVAAEVGYPYVYYLDDPSFSLPERATVAPWMSLLYRWETVDIGLVLYDGVDELALTAITDTYPRSFAAAIRTIAPERAVIETKHGLNLVPRASFETAPALDRVLVPGADAPESTISALEVWADSTGQPGAELLHVESNAFVFDATLQDMAREHSQVLSALAAVGLEYPIDHLPLAGWAWPYDLLPRPLALSLLGALAVIGIRRLVTWRWRGAHSSSRAGQPKQSPVAV